MQTRSSVLGKRQARPESTSLSISSFESDEPQIKFPITPESTPNSKRAKVALTVLDGDGNKENVPPFVNTIDPPSATRRSLRRTATEIASPSSFRSISRRHASLSGLPSATPSTALSYIAPTPPPTPPLILQPIYARARALLRSTCNGNAPLAGRHAERDIVINFITPFLETAPQAAEHSILYISGSPGTGKTALVNAVLRTMDNDFASAAVRVLFINCMALQSIDALWDRLIDELKNADPKPNKGAKAKKIKETSAQTLERLLAERPSKCVILLDELDHIASSSQSLTSFFTIAHTHRSHIRLIGIANTHTLSSSSTTLHSAQSLAGVKTLHFAPYTPQQLLEILQARLASLSANEDASTSPSEKADKFLPLPTLNLLTKKVAAQTGDVRAIMEVLRGAIDIAVNTNDAANPLAAPTPSVTPAHVLAALKAYAPAAPTARSAGSSAVPRKTSESEVVTKVKELGLQARLVLMAMVLATDRHSAGLPLSNSHSSSPSPTSTPRSPTKRSQSASSTGDCVDAIQLHTYYKMILSRADDGIFTPVSRSEFIDLLGMLETVGLVSLSSLSVPGTPSKSGKRGLSRCVSFSAASSKATSHEVRFVEGVRTDEVKRGLGLYEKEAGLDVMAEEVWNVWENERVRIQREVRAKPGASPVGEAFDEAVEG